MNELAGLITTATAVLVAWTGFLAYRIQRRNDAESWMTSFSELYSRFWWNDEMGRVRSWIACTPAYNKVRSVIRRRAQEQEVEPEDYIVLESVDRFCSILVQIVELNPGKHRKEQLRYYDQLYDRYWLQKLAKRQELRDYIGIFWPGLSSWIEKSIALRDSTGRPDHQNQIRPKNRLGASSAWRRGRPA